MVSWFHCFGTDVWEKYRDIKKEGEERERESEGERKMFLF
jgi:hypothetical protein